MNVQQLNFTFSSDYIMISINTLKVLYRGKFIAK